MHKKLCLLFIFIHALSWGQHTINGTFMPPEQFSYVFLYKSTPEGADYVDRSEISPEGKFSIPVDSTNTPGIYKLVYALPPEDYNFDIFYNGKEEITVHFDFEKGLDFSQSKANKLWVSYQKSMEMANTTITNFYTENGTDQAAFTTIFNILKEAQNAFENAAKNTPMTLTFIKANRPYIPTQYEDYKTYTANVKAHFLTHLNFDSPLLLSSDFLTNKVLAYVFGMSNNNSDYQTQIDHLAQNIKNPKAKTTYLGLLWQEFVNREHDAMANYITDTYLLDLATAQNNTELAAVITAYKRTSKGQLAPNFNVTVNTKNTTLHDLNQANKYLVVFWSSTCTHCLKELPQLETVIATIDKKALRVIAIALEDSRTHWQETITMLPSFTHVLGLQKWDNPIARSYNVHATPSYFLLDANKTIIAKPNDIEALKPLLNN